MVDVCLLIVGTNKDSGEDFALPVWCGKGGGVIPNFEC